MKKLDLVLLRRDVDDLDKSDDGGGGDEVDHEDLGRDGFEAASGQPKLGQIRADTVGAAGRAVPADGGDRRSRLCGVRMPQMPCDRGRAMPWEDAPRMDAEIAFSNRVGLARYTLLHEIGGELGMCGECGLYRGDHMRDCSMPPRQATAEIRAEMLRRWPSAGRNVNV